jgi:hypothetical protein
MSSDPLAFPRKDTATSMARLGVEKVAMGEPLADAIELSVVMPCLNESATLAARHQSCWLRLASANICAIRCSRDLGGFFP